MNINVFFSVVLIFVFSLSATPLSAQEKRALDHTDFDQWKSISNENLSPNGDFLLYGLNPQEGDGGIVVQSLRSGNESFLERGERFRLSYDGSTLAYFIAAPYLEQRQAKIDGKKPNEVFDDTLAVYHLATGELQKFPEVNSFSFPEKSGEWIAFLFDRELPEKKKNDEKEEQESPKTDEEHDEDHEDIIEKELVVLNLQTGDEIKIPHVESYYFTKHGERIVYVTADKDSLSTAGVHVMALPDFETMTISLELDSYTSVSMDSTASKIAFLAKFPTEDESEEEESDEKEKKEKEKEKDESEHYNLYYWSDGDESAGILADSTSAWLPEEWMINKHAAPEFSSDGSRLLFGIAPEPLQKNPEVEDIDVAKVDIWHWQDDELQPRQLIQLDQTKRKTYKTVFHIDSKQFVQLEDASLETVIIPNENNARYAMGLQTRPYMHLMQWEGFPGYADVYKVDLQDGSRKKIHEQKKAAVSTSPDGSYMIWYDYDQQNWFTYHFETEAITNLTGHVDVPFYDELNDRPMDPNPYGIAGWTKNDAHVIIRDRYDVWVFDPAEEGQGYMLTEGNGRANRIDYNPINPDPESRYFSDDTIFLSAMYESDKSTAVHRTGFDQGSAVIELWRDDVNASDFQKARESNTWILTKSTFQNYPDVYVTDERFRRFRKVTDTNPQQVNYLWGDVELFQFTSLDGVELDGLLYTPENFDPNKTYPMIVYFYERTSDRLHRYRAPAPSASTITPAFYTSRGYLVSIPDIVYKEGNPGRSAENAIIGMTLHLLDKGFVDRDRVALQGQSWGGYQIAHIITRTDMFAAAMAGAPVSNMTSAYGGIRWASGLNRQFQYEKTQSRIGGTLWERPSQYIENSPLFFADRVRTPLLMMHNDADGAVPWYQGIEFFTALKRLQQPVWMLNYNGEAHNLRDRVNRKDLSRRMQQFFDHYLKDAPMPVWMKYGVPAVEKGVNQGFELTDE